MRNFDTDEWREIDRDDSRFDCRILREKSDRSSLESEPEPAGRKSMVTTNPTKSLDQEYGSRAQTVYFGVQIIRPLGPRETARKDRTVPFIFGGRGL